MAHFRAGESEKAIEKFREAIAELRPQGPSAAPTDWLWLAMSYHRHGSAALANKNLDRFLQIVYPGGSPAMSSAGWPWETRIEFQILQKEGESLIRPYLRPLTLARGHVQKKEWEKAVVEFGRAIETKKDDHQFYLERGRAFAQLARWDEAAEDFAQSLKLLPAGSPLFGTVCGEAAKWPRAFAKTAKLRPEDPQFWLALGNFYASRGLWDEALVVYAKVFAKQPPKDTGIWHRYASLLAVTGDQAGLRRLVKDMQIQFGDSSIAYHQFELARAGLLLVPKAADAGLQLKQAQKAVSLSPRIPWLLYTLGTANYRAGNYKEAVRRLQESIDAGPNWFAVGLDWFVLAMAYHHLDQPKEAKFWLDKAVDWMDRSLTGATTPLVQQQWQDWTECQLLRREAESLIKGRPNSEDLKTTIARASAYSQLDMLDRAGQEYQRAYKRAPFDVQLRTDRARFYEKQGKWKEAIADWTVVIRSRPWDANLRLERGLAYTQIGLWLKSVGDLAKVIEQKPKEVEYICHYGPVLLLSENPRRYRNLCADAVKRFGKSNDPRTLYLTARLCGLAAESGVQSTVTLNLAKSAVQQSPKSAYYLHTLGMAHYRAGDAKTAVSKLNESLKADPNWEGRVNNWLGLALAYHRLGKTAESKENLDKAVSWIDQTTKALAKKPGVAFQGIHPHDWLACQVLKKEVDKQLSTGNQTSR
jgi:tetratricopeptide (TPR) repeat protein